MIDQETWTAYRKIVMQAIHVVSQLHIWPQHKTARVDAIFDVPAEPRYFVVLGQMEFGGRVITEGEPLTAYQGHAQLKPSPEPQRSNKLRIEAEVKGIIDALPRAQERTTLERLWRSWGQIGVVLAAFSCEEPLPNLRLNPGRGNTARLADQVKNRRLRVTYKNNPVKARKAREKRDRARRIISAFQRCIEVLVRTPYVGTGPSWGTCRELYDHGFTSLYPVLHGFGRENHYLKRALPRRKFQRKLYDKATADGAIYTGMELEDVVQSVALEVLERKRDHVNRAFLYRIARAIGANTTPDRGNPILEFNDYDPGENYARGGQPNRLPALDSDRNDPDGHDVESQNNNLAREKPNFEPRVKPHQAVGWQMAEWMHTGMIRKVDREREDPRVRLQHERRASLRRCALSLLRRGYLNLARELVSRLDRT